jgi:hypothetical protein
MVPFDDDDDDDDDEEEDEDAMHAMELAVDLDDTDSSVGDE